MIALVMVFVIFLIFFGIIGASRGWAKEVLVIASVILALATITLLEVVLKLDQLIKNATVWYWIRIGILFGLVLFGYKSPKVPRISKATEKSAFVGSWILGFIMGILSGYFVIGTAWYYSQAANYPLIGDFITKPTGGLADATQRVLNILPPNWLDSPWTVFFAVVVIFIFVIVYFV
jgi:hypothetical protein